MRTFKANVTRLTTVIREKFQETGDLYGYPGVTRALLLETCGQISNLASSIEIEDQTPNIEIITLKRMGSKLLPQLHQFVTEEASGKDAAKKFDDFVDKLTKLHEKTKQVFFIVNQNGLRADLELGEIRLKIEATTQDLATLEETRKKAQINMDLVAGLHSKTMETLEATAAAIKAFHVQSDASANAIQTQAKNAQEWFAALNTVHNNVQGWDKDIADRQALIKTNADQIKEQESKIRNQVQAFADLTSKADALTKLTETLSEKAQQLLSESETTLAGTNRAGMAASFADMKREMELAQKHWESIFYAGLGALILIAGGLITLQARGLLPFSVSGVFLRIAALTPPVWLTWFAVRKHGIANRVREDYAYKYSAARAYEGFRKAAAETNEDLAKDLIRIAILHLGLNPIRLYEDEHKEHASPYHEALERVLDLVGNFRKVEGKVSPNGVNASVESR